MRAEPELVFDMTEEYQQQAKTYRALTYAFWFLCYLLFEVVVLAILHIGGWQ